MQSNASKKSSKNTQKSLTFSPQLIKSPSCTLNLRKSAKSPVNSTALKKCFPPSTPITTLNTATTTITSRFLTPAVRLKRPYPKK